MTEAQYMATILEVLGDHSHGIDKSDAYAAAQMLRDQHAKIQDLEQALLNLDDLVRERDRMEVEINQLRSTVAGLTDTVKELMEGVIIHLDNTRSKQ